MSLIFSTLIMQMVTLVVLLLPFPYVVRSKIVHLTEVLQKSKNFTVGVVFSIILLGLQFMDCLQRLKRFSGPVDNPYFANSFGNMTKPSLTHEQMATKFYSQRNLYLTGAVLYLMLAIGTVTSIVRKLVKKEGEFRDLVAKRAGGDGDEVEKYKKLIQTRETDLKTLKKQVEGLQRQYDGLTKSEIGNKDD